MGTERTYRRIRDCQKKKYASAEKTHLISKTALIGGTVCIFITLIIFKIEIENILLYDKGAKTMALVYDMRSLRTGSMCLYEFNVSGLRYTGHDGTSNVGDSIEVVYLPQNPEINRNAKVLKHDWAIFVYRKITE